MTQIGTVIPREGINRSHEGDTLRCTARAEFDPNSPNRMNIGCQRFTLHSLLANGGTIGEYRDGSARVTFVGRIDGGYMRVPFHDTPQGFGNLNEYVRESVVVEPIVIEQKAYVRERLYPCDAEGHRHVFVVTRDGVTGEAVVALTGLTGQNDYTQPSPRGFIDNPECRPIVGTRLAHVMTDGRSSDHRFAALVAPGQLPNNTRVN